MYPALPWLILVLFISSFFSPYSPKANIANCEVSLSTNTLDADSTNNLTFTITNMDPSNPLAWVQVTRPSSDYTITSGSSSMGNLTPSDSTAVVQDFGLPPGNSMMLNLSIHTYPYEAYSASWTIQVSDDPNGSDATTCSGDINTSISGPHAPEPTPTPTPVIINTTTTVTTTVTNTVAEDDTTPPVLTLSFDSSKSYNTPPVLTGTVSDNVGVSSVEYAIDNSTTYSPASLASPYKQQSTFSFTLPKLTSGNHTFKVRAKDTSNNSISTTGYKILFDSLPPKVALTTDLSKPFTKASLLSGTLSDISTITSVSYSLDHGKTWQAIPNFTNKTFSFTPPALEDGDYSLQIRATDSATNSNIPATYNLIIDRLPPTLGLGIITYESIALSPNPDGTFTVLQNTPYQISITTAGGPVNIELYSSATHTALTHQVGTTLWTGTLLLTESGDVELVAHAIDGARNETSRTILKLHVLPQALITNRTHNTISNAKLRIYSFDNMTQKFVLWDAKSYNQTNPIQTDTTGHYSLILPSGKYYLEATHPLYRTNRSDIFTLQHATSISTSFVLTTKTIFKLGSLTFSLPSIHIDHTNIAALSLTPSNTLLNTQLPILDLYTNLTTISTNSFRGKNQIISVLNPWSSNTADQLASLENLPISNSKDASVVIPSLSASEVLILKHRGKYTSHIYADPDGQLLSSLNLFSSPTHIFIDSSGTIKKIITGLLTSQELVDNMVEY